MKALLIQMAACATLGCVSVYAQAGATPATTTNTGVTAAGTTATDGFLIANGRVYRIQSGRALLITRPTAINVTPNGVFGFDGKPLAFPEGQMLGVQGGFVPVPTGITGLPAGTQPANPGIQPIPPGTPPGGTPANIPPPGSPPTTPPNLAPPGTPPTTPPNLAPGTTTTGTTNPTTPGTTQPGTKPGPRR